MNDASANDYSAASSGNSAAFYDSFFGPMYFEPYAIEVVKHIDPDAVSVALEIAAGTGRVTRHIRDRIPPASRLIASDIDSDMLDIAKKQLSHLNIEWQIIDAQQLPFDDNSVDLVVCCFGYMFVPDKEKTFAEAYRVLKQGGMLLFTTWDKLSENAASYLARSIAAEYSEKPIGESDNLATSMNDKTAIRALLQSAGFSKTMIEKVRLSSVSSSAKEAAHGLVDGGGPVYDEIRKRNAAWITEIKDKLEKALADKYGTAPMVAPISAVMCRAWK